AAVSDQWGGGVHVSTNGGNTWVNPTGGNNGEYPWGALHGVAWQTGTTQTFVAVGAGGAIWRTTNPATGTWGTPQTSPVTARLNAVTYVNTPITLFVAVGDNGKIITSATGQNNSWTERESGVNVALRA